MKRVLGLPVVEWMLVAVVVGLIALVAMPTTISRSELDKLEQSVPPMDLRGVGVREVLEHLAKNVELPVPLRACTHLQDASVTVRTSRPERLDFIVGAIGVQLGAQVRLRGGHHGEMASPRLLCQSCSGQVIASPAPPTAPAPH